MIRVAWWMCALLALADARIYERCELARDLHALGVDPDDIATWVCIAYHESRFDTAANNPHSGDHGLFQISELYWCGPGKACGLPCSSLRNEDISDDLECALQVHEEHTRLQGNGFLAWVVYPQHCKHNTKKYLVNCDTAAKSPPVFEKPRSFAHTNYYTNFTHTKHIVEDLIPPYLTIASIFRGNYGKVLGPAKGKDDWTNYKISNIDDLKLPVFGGNPVAVTVPSTTTTTTPSTTTVYIPPVKPWRVIETNQFRKKQLPLDKAITKKDYSVSYQQSTPSITTYNNTTTPSTTIKTTVESVSSATPPLLNITASSSSATTVSTTTSKASSYSSIYSTYTTTERPSVETTYRSRTVSISNHSNNKTTKLSSAARPWTTYKPFVSTPTKPPTTTTWKPKSDFSWYTFTSRTTSTTPATTKSHVPSQTSTYRPYTQPLYRFSQTLSSRTNTQSRMLQPYGQTSISQPYRQTPTASTTPRSFSQTLSSRTNTQSTTVRPFSQTWTIRPFVTTTSTQRPWYTQWSRSQPFGQVATSRNQTTTRPFGDRFFSQTTTRQRQTFSSTTTPKTGSSRASTSRPLSQTFTSRPSTQSQQGAASTKKSHSTEKPKTTTQSIFDLYLNPTKAPKLPSYHFSSDSDNWFKLKIFSGGTTTTAPPKSTTRDLKTDYGGATRNYIRRQTSLESH